MSPSEVTTLLAELVSAYSASNPNGAGRLSEDTRVTYVECLYDLDFEAAKVSVRDLIRHNKFFPTVAEIRDAVIQRRTGLEEPELAWGAVMVALRKHGRSRRPCFFNVATEAAVLTIGWNHLCDSDESSLTAIRAHFFRIYESARKRINLAVEDGSIQLGSATARAEALRAAGHDEPELIFIAPGEDPKLPPAVAEMRFRQAGDVVGKVIARIDLDPKEGKK